MVCDILPQIRDNKGKYVDSQLFKDLLNKHKDRDKAKSIYRQVHSDVFMDKYGDWINDPLSINSKLDVNGEPLINTVDQYITDDVDYFPAEVQEVKKKSKYENLITLKKQQIRDIRAKITSNKGKMSNASIDRKKQLLKAIETLNNKVTKLEDQIEELQTNEALEYVYSLAEDELDEANKLIKQGTMTPNEILYVDRVLNTWEAAGNMNTDNHLFLEPEDFEHEGIVESFSNYRSRAMLLGNELDKIKTEFLKDFVEDALGKEFTEEDLLGDIVDVSTITKFTRDVQKVNHPIFRAIFTTLKSATLGAKHNTTEVWNKIDADTEKALPILKRLNPQDPFKPFKQTLSNGKLTGNLTHFISQDFFNEIKRLRHNAFNKEDDSSKSREAYNEFKNKNLIQLDPRILIEDSNIKNGTIPSEYIYADGNNLQEWVKEKSFTDTEKQAHINDIKAQLGDQLYNKYQERLNTNIERFKEERQAIFEQIEDSEGTKEEKIDTFTDWLKINSPYFYLHSKDQVNVLSKLVNNKRIFYKGVKGFSYTFEIPRRTIGGKDSGWYDKNYDVIAANPDLKALHETTLDILSEVKKILPDGKVNGVQINTLPFIEKTIIDMFSEKGMKIGIMPFWDKLKEMSRASDISDIVYDDVDPLTGQIEDQVRFGATLTHEKEISDYIAIQEAEYISKNPKYTDSDLIKVRAKARVEIIDKIAQRKSFDLGMVMKSYYLLAQSFKHKSLIEDQIGLAFNMFKTIDAQKTNSIGDQLKQASNDNLLTDEKGISNMIEMMEYYLDSQLYGKPTKQIAGKTKKKLFTKEESAKIKELESTIGKLETLLESKKLTTEKAEEVQFRISKLVTQKESLGGVLTATEFGDLILKYNQLKNMGWNILSGFANVGFGLISNYVEGSDGRVYNNKDLTNAYGLVLHSLSAFYTGTVTESLKTNTAIKIRSLMDGLDVLKDSSYEVFEKTIQSSFTKKVKSFAPYEATKRTEYLNQAPLMIALMKKDTILDKEGNESILWEAFNVDGQLKEEFRTDENVSNWEGANPVERIKFQLKLDEVIKRNHGNYDPDSKPMKNKIWFVKALFQFRTWMIEGFASRFEKARPDEILGYEIKGRYRTLFNVKQIKEDTGMGGTELIFFNLKQLTRKLLMKPTQYNDAGFNKTDAANMRKNLTELVIYMSLYGIGLALRAAVGDDEDENLALNFLINQGNRLETDILMYTNPMEFERIQQSALPLASLITDTYKWTEAVARQFDDERRTVDGGPLDGMNWLVRRTTESLPFGRQGLRVVKNLKQAND